MKWLVGHLASAEGGAVTFRVLGLRAQGFNCKSQRFAVVFGMFEVGFGAGGFYCLGARVLVFAYCCCTGVPK